MQAAARGEWEALGLDAPPDVSRLQQDPEAVPGFRRASMSEFMDSDA